MIVALLGVLFYMVILLLFAYIIEHIDKVIGINPISLFFVITPLVNIVYCIYLIMRYEPFGTISIRKWIEETF